MKHSIKYLLLQIFGSPLALLMWTLVVLIVPNVVLDITEPTSWLWKIANIIAPAGFYLCVLSWTRKTGVAVLCALPWMIFAAFQLVLSYLFGEAIIAVDMFLNVVTTNVEEVNELLGNLFYAILTVVLLYLPPLIWAIVLTCKKKRLSGSQRNKVMRYGVYVMLVGIIATIAAEFSRSGGRFYRELFPLNVVCNLGEAINRTNQARHYPETSKDFTYKAVSERPDSLPEIYVMVIGETARAINWQLAGYERPTNPRLSRRSGLTFFPKAISQSNTTHKSVPMMMSCASAETFDSIQYYKSILTAMKEAGFYTRFFSNQAPNHSYTEFFGNEADDIRYADFSRKPHPFDHEMVDWLRQAVADTIHRKQFIVMHTYGSHFLYRDRYPQSESYFSPDNMVDANSGNRPCLINGYDNTIRYTDHVLDGIIGVLDGADVAAGLVYSSDHGEDIFDDRRNRFLHASPNPTYYQLHVASLAWMSDELQSLHPEFVTAIKTNRTKPMAPQTALFHTALQMAGVKSPLFRPESSLVDESYNYGKPLYVTDLNQGVPLEKSGLKDLDFEKLSTLLSK